MNICGTPTMCQTDNKQVYKQVNVKYQVLVSAMMENSQMFGK